MVAPENPVVLLHAFPVNSAMWTPVADALAAAGHQVLTPDQRGFGRHPIPLGDHSPSLDVVADDVAALLDAERIDRAVVGGVSMGGYVALAFLRKYPQRVAGLMLMDTKATRDPKPARENRERIARTLLDEHSPRVLLEELVPNLVGPTTRENRPVVLDQVRAMAAATQPEAGAWAQRAMADRSDSLETLRSLGPAAGSGVLRSVLVLRGEEDELCAPADLRAMVDAVGRGPEVVVRGAGHLTPLEAPEEVTAAVAGYLDTLARERAR